MTTATRAAERDFDDATSDLEARTFATGSLSQGDGSARCTTRATSERSAARTAATTRRESAPVPHVYGVETELSRLRGVVIRVNEDVVEVAFQEPQMEVAFPAVLLGEGLARYGQSVDYIVRQRADGYRYQAFSAAPSDRENPYTSELEALLSVVDDG